MKFNITKYESQETGYGVYYISKDGKYFYTSWWPETGLQEDQVANDNFILYNESKKFCKTLKEAKQLCLAHLEKVKKTLTKAKPEED